MNSFTRRCEDDFLHTNTNDIIHTKVEPQRLYCVSRVFCNQSLGILQWSTNRMLPSLSIIMEILTYDKVRRISMSQ
ncbi:hypothetical protein M0802_006179 [Mischocyttarus mexicanus]|nr:hypothetical protein M0802_006179 [Mischocyttarus mexicanus]